MEYLFSCQQYLPIPVERAWEFFSSPRNLAKITPPEMEFKILTQLDDKPIYDGMNIEYIVRPIGRIPMRWKTEIIQTVPYKMFTDTQIKGPYTKWEHQHVFESQNNGTLMTDVVKYKLPLGWLGDLAHSLFVRKRIQEIFNYREKTLQTLFPHI